MTSMNAQSSVWKSYLKSESLLLTVVYPVTMSHDTNRKYNKGFSLRCVIVRAHCCVLLFQPNEIKHGNPGQNLVDCLFHCTALQFSDNTRHITRHIHRVCRERAMIKGSFIILETCMSCCSTTK